VLTIVDIAMLNAIAFDVLAPGLVRLAVPLQRLEIVATGVNASISSLWILLDPSFDCTATQQATSPTTVGEVAVDLAHLMIGDFAALASWRSDHSENDFENVPHDVVFWGKDASGLATLLNASDHRDGFGWVNLTEKLAEQKMNSIARRKQDHGWQLTIEQRPHTDYYQIAEVARASLPGATRGKAKRHSLAAASSTRGVDENWLMLDAPAGVFPVFAHRRSSAKSRDELVAYQIDLRLR
jgi:hypothetical protein